MSDASPDLSTTGPTESLVGREFLGRYRLLEPVGRGGMSVVYKALHLKMDRIVAVKVLSKSLAQDEAQVRLFNKEAFASSRLAHPNTIKVFDFGESEDGYLFIVMEHLDGETLGALLRRTESLALAKVFRIMRQICKSLAEAHSVGIIHRDLKPENIFITNIYGEEDYVKVLDFGIAKVLGPDIEEHTPSPSGRIWGSPLYLSPEHILNRPVSIQSDLYSLGCVLFEMLAGRPPFVAKKAIDVVMAHVEESPPKLTELMGENAEEAAALDVLMGELLAKDFEERPESAEALLDRFEDLAHDLGIKSPGTDPSRMAVDGMDPSGEAGAGALQSTWLRGILVIVLFCVGALVAFRPGGVLDPLKDAKRTIPKGAQATITTKKVESSTEPKLPVEPVIFEKEFLVQSEPSGAAVILGTQELGKTPFLLKFSEEQKEKSLIVRKSGFEELRVDLSKELVGALPEQGLSVKMQEKRKTNRGGSSSSGKKGKSGKKKWKTW